MTSLFDSHCHLDFELFDAQREAVLADCCHAGVRHIVIPGVSVQTWSRMLAVCQRYGNASTRTNTNVQLHPALGLHPCFMTEHGDDAIQRLEQYLSEHQVVAVGEIGLDFWPGHLEPDRQLELFEAQLQLAVQVQLPVIIHSRKAHDQVWQRLKAVPRLKGGVIHAFSGSRQQADRFLDLGFKLGIGGAITYERANKLRKIVAEMPLESIVLETDAPDMPLSGRQGQPNRPSYLPEVLQCLAELRPESLEVVSQQVWENSLRLFSLPD